MEKRRLLGVVGAGTMGNGIAHVFARAGFEVVLCEVNGRRWTRGWRRSGQTWIARRRRGDRSGGGGGDFCAGEADDRAGGAAGLRAGGGSRDGEAGGEAGDPEGAGCSVGAGGGAGVEYVVDLDYEAGGGDVAAEKVIGCTSSTRSR